MRNPPHRRKTLISFGFSLAAIALAIAMPLPASIMVESYDLNRSNILPDDGTIYGTVTLSADSASGTITVTYSVNPATVPGPLSNFGLQEVALNTDLKLSQDQISADNDWDASFGFKSLPGFGQFNIIVKGQGDNRQTTEKITVTGLTSTQATIAHFTIESLDRKDQVTEQGSVYFAAREAGFRGARNTFIGGGETADSVDAPEPISLLLVAGAFCLLGAAHRRRSKRDLPFTTPIRE